MCRADAEVAAGRVVAVLVLEDAVEPLASFEKPEGKARAMEATGRCQPRQAAADDEDRIRHEQFEGEAASIVVVDRGASALAGVTPPW